MAVTVAELVERLALRLELTEAEQLRVAEYAAEVLEAVAAYLHTPEVPEELLHTCVSMAESLWRTARAGDGGEIQSITEGDTSITYRSGSGPGGLPALLTQHRAVLRQYRRVVWE